MIAKSGIITSLNSPTLVENYEIDHRCHRLFDWSNESRNVFIGFERKNIVYVGSDKQEREIFAEDIVTPAFVDAHSQKVW